MRTSTPSRGFEISYRVDGDGPPLLLLHGWSRWADDSSPRFTWANVVYQDFSAEVGPAFLDYAGA